MVFFHQQTNAKFPVWSIYLEYSNRIVLEGKGDLRNVDLPFARMQLLVACQQYGLKRPLPLRVKETAKSHVWSFKSNPLYSELLE